MVNTQDRKDTSLLGNTALRYVQVRLLKGHVADRIPIDAKNTDMAGRLLFSDVPLGSYTIIANKDGYLPYPLLGDV